MSLRRISILVALGVLVAAPGALAASLPKVPSYSGPTGKGDFKVKPGSIDYAMGSGFFAGAKHHGKVGSLKWSSWNSTSGHGSGFNWINNCKPDCAHGKFTNYPVKLRVWHRHHIRGHLLFTRMTVTYTGKKPQHTHKTEVWKLTHNKNVFFWMAPSN